MSSAPPTQKIDQIDPLLQDLNEKKQNFRRNVVSLAAELKDARSRLASKEESLACETRFRQVIIPIGFFFSFLFTFLITWLFSSPLGRSILFFLGGGGGRGWACLVL